MSTTLTPGRGWCYARGPPARHSQWCSTGRSSSSSAAVLHRQPRHAARRRTQRSTRRGSTRRPTRLRVPPTPTGSRPHAPQPYRRPRSAFAVRERAALADRRSCAGGPAATDEPVWQARVTNGRVQVPPTHRRRRPPGTGPPPPPTASWPLPPSGPAPTTVASAALDLVQQADRHRGGRRALAPRVGAGALVPLGASVLELFSHRPVPPRCAAPARSTRTRRGPPAQGGRRLPRPAGTRPTRAAPAARLRSRSKSGWHRPSTPADRRPATHSRRRDGPTPPCTWPSRTSPYPTSPSAPSSWTRWPRVCRSRGS